MQRLHLFRKSQIVYELKFNVTSTIKLVVEKIQSIPFCTLAAKSDPPVIESDIHVHVVYNYEIQHYLEVAKPIFSCDLLRCEVTS